MIPQHHTYQAFLALSMLSANPTWGDMGCPHGFGAGCTATQAGSMAL
jgi:hypothetical protein